MGYEREHALGTPSWVDLATPDLVVSARFYGGLFGWETVSRGPADLTGGYLHFQREGQDVGGLAPMGGGEPPAWTVHIAVADADEAERAAIAHGGATLLAPIERVDHGRTALFSDPTGAVYGVWQAIGFPGAELLSDTGALCWIQLASRNIEASKRFYGSVFGWTGFTAPYETSTYTRFRLDDREVAGMVEMDRTWPRDLPSHWMPHFEVDDCDAAVERALELDGDVPVEPYDLADLGRAAVLGDPHGAVFGVMARDVTFKGLSRPNPTLTRSTLDGDTSTPADKLANRPSP